MVHLLWCSAFITTPAFHCRLNLPERQRKRRTEGEKDSWGYTKRFVVNAVQPHPPRLLGASGGILISHRLWNLYICAFFVFNLTPQVLLRPSTWLMTSVDAKIIKKTTSKKPSGYKSKMSGRQTSPRLSARQKNE